LGPAKMIFFIHTLLVYLLHTS